MPRVKITAANSTQSETIAVEVGNMVPGGIGEWTSENALSFGSRRGQAIRGPNQELVCQLRGSGLIQLYNFPTMPASAFGDGSIDENPGSFPNGDVRWRILT